MPAAKLRNESRSRDRNNRAPPAGDYRGAGDSVPMSRFDLDKSAQRDVRQRMGPDQRRLELVQIACSFPQRRKRIERATTRTDT